MRPKTLV